MISPLMIVVFAETFELRALSIVQPDISFLLYVFEREQVSEKVAVVLRVLRVDASFEDPPMMVSISRLRHSLSRSLSGGWKMNELKLDTYKTSS